jgi:hypothetical protein
LTSIELPVAENIGEGAFNECTSLTNIVLPVAINIGVEVPLNEEDDYDENDYEENDYDEEN